MQQWHGANTGQTPGETTLLAQAYKLRDGVQHATLTFNSVAFISTVTAVVTLRNSAAYWDVNHDGAVNNTDLQRVEAAAGTNNTMPNFNYRYDLNRDGVVDACSDRLC
jgi:Dockerin type I domain